MLISHRERSEGYLIASYVPLYQYIPSRLYIM